TYRAQGDALTVLHGPRGNVLYRVWANGWPGQFVFRDLTSVHFAAASHCKRLPSRDQQGGNFKILNPCLFCHKLAETNQHLLEFGERRRTPFAEESLVKLALPKHPACEGGIKRRQTNREIAINIGATVCGAQHQYRAELGIDPGPELGSKAAVL